MPFVIGGRYAVERELGRGGMGRVFLATDQRLRRRVALKVLASRTPDASELRRLEREARLVGSLGHPNVVDVHDIGSFEGQPFIVEEYLEGETLRARLGAGSLSPALALDIGTQIARGLAAAHDKGVVHCDLKPENLVISREGAVKILDFGVARFTAAAASSRASLEDGASAHSGPTGFAGTPAYSSPEQVSGGSLDARSDIFSFGAVLYEMLAGKRAFAGGGPVEVAYAVLHGVPAPLSAGLPAEIRRLVARCLEKDPQSRFQSAKDLALGLESLARTPAQRRRKLLRRVELLAVIAGGIVAAALIGHKQQGALPSFRQITFVPGAVWTARFTTDGREVSYTAGFDGKPPRVYSTRLGSPQYQRPEVSDAALLAISPRGELALVRHPEFSLFHFAGTLAVLPTAGNAPRDLLEQADFADWGPDGSSLAVVRRTGAEQRLEYPLNTLLFQTKGWLSDPRVSPDGDKVAFFHHPTPTDDHGALMLARRGHAAVELAGGWSAAKGLAWSPDGSEIWFTAAGAGESAIALRALRLDGAQRVLAQTSDDLELHDVSRAGTALVTAPHRYMGMAISDGRGDRDLSIRDEQVLHDLSADGSQVLFVINPRSPDGEGAIFVRRTDGSPPVQIAAGYGGALSPDGRSAFVFSAVAGRPASLVPIGPGETRVLDSIRLAVSWARFFPDGRRVLVAGREPGSATRLYVISLESASLRPISGEGVDPARAAVSSDGSQVAGVDPRARIMLYPADGGDPAEVPEAVAGEIPYGWTADGGLLVGRPLEVPVNLFRIDTREHRRTPWKTIKPTEPGAYAVARVLVAQAGDALAYSQLSWKTPLYVMEGLH